MLLIWDAAFKISLKKLKMYKLKYITALKETLTEVQHRVVVTNDRALKIIASTDNHPKSMSLMGP